eukprot:8839827-Ditylum_brightwellii.AAC.1
MVHMHKKAERSERELVAKYHPNYIKRGAHDVGAINSDIDSRSRMSHIGETDDFCDANKSVSEKDESALFESDDALSNASACLSGGVQTATVTGYAYGLQSSGSVMPEILPPVVENFTLENGTSSGMQP